MTEKFKEEKSFYSKLKEEKTASDKKDIDFDNYENSDKYLKDKKSTQPKNIDLLETLSKGSFGQFPDGFFTPRNVGNSRSQDIYNVCSTDKRNETIKYLPVENVKVNHSEEGSQRAPINGRQVNSLLEFFNSLDGIAHFAVHRYRAYFHHFIVTGWIDTEKRIIEYCPCFFSSMTGRGEVVERSLVLSKETIIKSIEDGDLYVIQTPDYPQTDEEMTRAKERFLERLGEQSYGLAYNNCEHLVSYILTGTPKSEQIIEAGPWKMFAVNVAQTIFVDFKQNAWIVGSYLLSRATFVLRENAIELTSIVWANPSLLDYKKSNFPLSATVFILGALNGGFTAVKMRDLDDLKKNKHITEDDYERETKKAIYESIARSGTGLIGEVFYHPIPGLGYSVASTVGNIGGRLLGFMCPICGGIH